MSNDDNDNNKIEIGNDGGYPSDYGALLVEPAPPERGTFTLLLPENFTWGARRRNGAIRITFREVNRTSRREDIERQEGED